MGLVLKYRENMETIHQQAREALDSLDDCARMDCGVDAFGARGILERYIDEMEKKLAERINDD